MTEHKNIEIIGAQEHNLKNINVKLPRNQLIVITGVSGSGKSSLAFDTLYAEGQRRYVESLSAYARQFLDRVQKPKVEQIYGLSPAISIEQKTTNHNPRSTVGTVTEIYDYLRLLFARIGTPYSPTTGLPIESQTVSQMVDKVLELPEKSRIYILAPIARGRKGEYKKELLDLQKKGFTRAKIDGQFYLLEEAPNLEKNFPHDIDIVVDRLVINNNIQARLTDSLETALQLADGLAIIELADKPHANSGAYKSKNETHERLTFSEKFACPDCGFTITELEPRLFSFNNPVGACPSCNGLGIHKELAVDLLIPNPKLSIEEGAIAPWKENSFRLKALQTISKFYKFKLSTPWEKLPENVQDVILYGSKEKLFEFTYHINNKPVVSTRPFEGLIPTLNRKWQESESNNTREDIERYMLSSPCSSCNGYRLKQEAYAVKIANFHIGEISSLAISDTLAWFNDLPQQLSNQQLQIAKPILKEINERLNFLISVGLDYLSLSRMSNTLSGGESQRIRLASQIGSGLTGVLYVLDEPSIGLHQRDNDRLIATLKHLVNLGNTVVVVEHDEDAIFQAQHIVDVGPLAGVNGGEIVAAGTIKQIIKNKRSITGKYLSGEYTISRPQKHFDMASQPKIIVSGADGHNLKHIEVEIPLQVLTCITGVSGSGKSTFLLGTLLKAAQNKLNRTHQQTAPYKSISGLEHIDKIIHIDQSPIGRTPRSNPATYTGMFTYIREWYANLPESKARGYKAGRFSFNIKGGRCEACQGDGVIKIEMHFLPDIYVTCDVCNGKRYNRETLEIKYKGASIYDVLEMTVAQGLEFFNNIPKIQRELQILMKVGLDYIKIGQSATTLSGGEAQRIKFSKELSKRPTGKTMYILDEPTTGLHFHDIAKLLELLNEFTLQGNSVVVIEHNMDIIKNADWIIDFGPEGGNKGGEIIAAGTPEMVMQEANSYTGQFLKIFAERDRDKLNKN